LIAFCAIIKGLSSKNRKTPEAIFSHPSRTNIKWEELKKLLTALGAELHEGEGSRVHFMIGVAKLVLHRPHPGNEAKEYQVEAVRKFLRSLEIKP
jgi:hypothetical protein